MKTIRFGSILAVLLMLFVVSAQAQKRKPKPRPRPPVTMVPIDVRIAKEKVSNQIANLTRFIDILGPITASIEAVDREAKTRTVKKAVLEQNEVNKGKVLLALRNLRAGLVALETEFRTKPTLRKYLVKIEGISVLSAQSEDSASAGHFIESRRPLLTVLQKLSDTYPAMV